MFLLLAIVLWITITGANYPSELLSDFFVGWLYPLLKSGAETLHFPWWLSGFLIDGIYLATTWVISVMLPPMAIFFPLFTLLEDFGYLPRVAFNLDKLFRRAGAHGKQALTMSMGFARCNRNCNIRNYLFIFHIVVTEQNFAQRRVLFLCIRTPSLSSSTFLSNSLYLSY